MKKFENGCSTEFVSTVLRFLWRPLVNDRQVRLISPPVITLYVGTSKAVFISKLRNNAKTKQSRK
jgi:hypothetical protein